MKIFSQITILILLTIIIQLEFNIVGVITLLSNANGETFQDSNDFILIFGASSSPEDLDPQYAWDSASIDVIDQVCEGLYTYNLSDPELAIIPSLAIADGTWTIDGLIYTVLIRQGVTFHDGTKFNATAVKWTFDRLAYLMNATGTLPTSVGVTQIKYLYENKNMPIINNTVIIDEYTVSFVLHTPFTPFQALLCFSGSYILSPTSTNATGYIDMATGDLVGTGPFVYDLYTEDVEVRFHAFENYWDGAPNVNNLTFSIIKNENHRNQALLNGTIDFLDDPLPNMLDTFETDPNITLVSTQDSFIRYLGMNNKQINKTWRQAISYAINYSYIINEIMEGQAVRLKSPIPIGIRWANWSFNVAIYNITKARQILIDAGVCSFDLYSDTEWINATLVMYNYTYNIGNIVRESIGYLLQENLRQIGINVTLAGMNWTDFIYRLYELTPYTRDMIQLYFFGWVPDYNDPSNFINSLLSNTSSSNTAQYYNYTIQLWMDQALNETNDILRRQLYDNIQKVLVEDHMPWAFGYVGFIRYAYRSDIIGYQSNSLGKKRFYDISQKELDNGLDNGVYVISITCSGIGAVCGIAIVNIVPKRISIRKGKKVKREAKKKIIEEMESEGKPIDNKYQDLIKKLEDIWDELFEKNKREIIDIFEKLSQLLAEDKHTMLESFQKLVKEQLKREMVKKIIVEMKSEGKPIDRKYKDLIKKLEELWMELSGKYLRKIREIIKKYIELKAKDKQVMLECFQKLASEFLLGCKLCRQNNFDEGLRKLQKVAKMAKKEGFGDLAKEAKISNSEFLIEKRTFSGR